MNFKKYTKVITIAFALSIAGQSFGEHASPIKPSSKKTVKEMLARATSTSKETITHVADASKQTLHQATEKFGLSKRDLLQGTVIGSALLGASFLTRDPKLQLTLRVLAAVPMVIGTLAPKKLIQKVSKLEIENKTLCANHACKGICSQCRITKTYLAALPLGLLYYGISWLFTPRATTPVDGDSAVAEAMADRPGNETRQTGHPEDSRRMTDTPTQGNTDNVIILPEQNSVSTEQQAPAPDQVPAPNAIPKDKEEEDQQENTQDAPYQPQEPLSPTRVKKLNEEARQFIHENGLDKSDSEDEQEPANDNARKGLAAQQDEEPMQETPVNQSEPSQEESSGWGWLGDKLAGWIAPEVDYDHFDI